MTKKEALANAVAAVNEAQQHLHANKFELAYSWSVLADTWASVARAIDPEPEPDVLGPCTHTVNQICAACAPLS
jgi:hypothetical protein